MRRELGVDFAVDFFSRTVIGVLPMTISTVAAELSPVAGGPDGPRHAPRGVD